MTLITRFELATLSTAELRGLWREVFNQLAASNPDSPQRRDALASLETIEAELRDRLIGPAP